MRKMMYELLTADAGLLAAVPKARWYQQGAVLDRPEMPFVILRWISPVSGDARGTFAHQFQLAVYDQRGSYSRIDAFLGGPYKTGGAYPILNALAGIAGVDGYIAQADYLGDSGDDVDIDYKANTKFSSWQIAGRSFS